MEADIKAGRPEAAPRRPGANAGRRRLIYFVGVCLLLQGLYWGALRPVLTAPRPSFDSIEVGSAQVATIAGPDQTSLAAAAFRPLELPYDECCEARGYRAVRMTFHLDRAPGDLCFAISGPPWLWAGEAPQKNPDTRFAIRLHRQGRC